MDGLLSVRPREVLFEMELVVNDSMGLRFLFK